MIISPEFISNIEEIFEQISSLKSRIADTNMEINGHLDYIATQLSSNEEQDSRGNKKSAKNRIKKAVRKAYKEWQARKDGDDSSDDADAIVAQLIVKE